MSALRMIATSIPAGTLEWCSACGMESNIDSFTVSRCPACEAALLPCSTCTHCKINEQFNACARFGLSLDNQADETERLLDLNYLRSRCVDIEIRFLLEPEIYLDYFITSMIADLRSRGVPIDSLQIFCDANRCSLNPLTSKIKLVMEKIRAEFPALSYEQAVCLGYWETFCTGSHRSILRILQNKDKL